jgi:hypothetical protein
VVREHAGIADDQVIMKSIALGWPDENFPAIGSCIVTAQCIDTIMFRVDDGSSSGSLLNNNFVHCHRNPLSDLD